LGVIAHRTSSGGLSRAALFLTQNNCAHVTKPAFGRNVEICVLGLRAPLLFSMDLEPLFDSFETIE
jgi:hypothetical protein